MEVVGDTVPFEVPDTQQDVLVDTQVLSEPPPPPYVISNQDAATVPEINPLLPCPRDVVQPGRREAVLDTLRHVNAEDQKKRHLTKQQREMVANVINFVNLSELLRNQGEPYPDTVAALRIAQCKIAIGNKGLIVAKGPWFARRLMQATAEVFKTGNLLEPTQGKGAKRSTLLDAVGVRPLILKALKEMEKGKVSSCLRSEAWFHMIPRSAH